MVDTTEFNLVPNNEEEEFTVDFGEVIRLAGSSDFNQLQNRPQYDGQVMTGETDIPKVPTATSELNNDSDYQTGSEVQQTINAAIANKQDKLTAGQNITISEQNVISATGLTEVDWGDIGGNLNDQIDLKDVLDAKQDTLTPGDNVTITNNTISATDTKYTAGNGLSLNGTQFSADTAVLQEKLDAGNAITIENNTINADIYPADFFTNDAADTDTGSNITLDKTIPATLKSVELYGDTEQQTYTGKNKVFFSPITTTSNGIEWIVTNDTISASGTATSNWSIPVGYASFASPLPAGQYTLSIPTVIDKSLQLNLREEDNTSHDINIMAGEKSVTFTTTYTSVSFRFALRAESETTTNINLPNQLQLETGSTATSYEKFVGGTASPNPDYPQDVNVVTGEQTVTVTGKNLFNKNGGNILTAYFDNAITTITSNANNRTIFIPCLPNTTYSLQKLASPYARHIGSTSTVPSIGTSVNILGNFEPNSTTKTITTDNNAKYLVIRLWSSAQDSSTIEQMLASVQIEAGPTPTAYEPYQSQSYTVDLGSTELCKLGDYQDYIYKSGDDWYVHKALGKSELGSLTWLAGGTSTSGLYRMYTNGLDGLYVAPPDNNTAGVGLCSHFLITANNTALGSYGGHISLNLTRNGDTVFAFHPDYTASTSGAGFKTWLTDNSVVLYYALTTPTDIKITDAGLIADLNALAGAKSYLDVTNFTVSATGTNLPALLKPEVYVNSLNGVLESAENKQEKLIAGENITIDGNVISAEGSSITPVQTPGSSTTDVMSQNATTSMIFADPTTQRKIKIGTGTFVSEGDNGIEIGKESKAKGVGTVAIGSEATVDSFASEGVAIGASTTTFGDNAIAIGYTAGTNSEKAVALGRGAQANHSFSVALGAGATTSVAGEINVGTGSTYPTRGYNNTNYRLIRGVHSPVVDHDAATKVYVDSYIANSMIIKPINSFEYNFDSTDPTNTDPLPENCNSWALWKFPSYGVAFLSYENNLGNDIYISGGSNPQTIAENMGPEAATAGFIVGADVNGVVNAAIYSVTGQMGPFQTDASTGEPA